MEKNRRTVTCGGLRKADAGKDVILNGWVHRKRSHGGIQFIDLRDRYGITQIVVDENSSETLAAAANELKFEYCVAVKGSVRPRPETMVNPQMATGEIEVLASEIEILTKCDVLPFMIDERSDAREDLRLKYRYLDLRSFSMQRKIRLRHEVTFRVREYLNGQGFYEIETPTFIKSTPEGARDFLVPARLHPGKFFALPQSPQLYKQILMVSGLDKYFQIARCYRDEDARGDRQLEFTQIDIEMSFVSREDVFRLVEGLFGYVFRNTIGVELTLPFPRITFDDALNLYGTDKPDLRFDLRMQDFSGFASKGEFQAFRTALEAKDGTVKALVAKGCGEYSRKQISELEDAAKTYGAKGLAWMKVTAAGLEGGVSKFFEKQAKEIVKALGAGTGDLILLVGDRWRTACLSLGAVRSRLGRDLKLADEKQFALAWVVDFPLFEYNEEEKRWESSHHMFTMPQERFLDTLEQDPGAVKGDLYDLVCNGYELASGSIRIHDPELQQRIFDIVGFDRADAQQRFGFLMDAFRFGAPPHGGIAPGLDRLVMIMAGENSIREVIAFPRNTVGVMPMDDSPSTVDQRQLDDLHIRIDLPEDGSSPAGK